MENIKKYIKPLIYFYIVFITYLILITTLSYFNIVNYKIISIMSFIMIILLFIFLGFFVAYKSNKKGYINGLIVGGFNIILFLFIAFILGNNPKLNVGIYFLVLLLSSTIGGMLGINYKNRNNK